MPHANDRTHERKWPICRKRGFSVRGENCSAVPIGQPFGVREWSDTVDIAHNDKKLCMKRSLSFFNLLSDIHCIARHPNEKSRETFPRFLGRAGGSKNKMGPVGGWPWQKMAAHLADDIKAYIKPVKKAIQPFDRLNFHPTERSRNYRFYVKLGLISKQNVV